MKRYIQILTGVSILFASCSDDDQIVTPDINSVLNVVWKLDAIEYPDSSLIFLAVPDTVVLVFLEDERVEGHAQGMCPNRYFGSYRQLTPCCLKLDSLVSTEAGCPKSRYWHFFDRLSEVNGFRISGDELTLYYGADKKRLMLRRMD